MDPSDTVWDSPASNTNVVETQQPEIATSLEPVPQSNHTNQPSHTSHTNNTNTPPRKVSIRTFDQSFLRGILSANSPHLQLSPRPTPDDLPAYVEPALGGDAHLIWTNDTNDTNDPHLPKSNNDDVNDANVANDATSNTSNTHSDTHPGCIYLGSSRSTHSLETLQNAGIGAIVNCTKRIPCHYRKDEGMLYCQVAINDTAAADILSHLPAATSFIHACLTGMTGWTGDTSNTSNTPNTSNKRHKPPNSVLIHCEAGVSRSASVAIAYLMRYHSMTRDEAYVHVKKRRLMVQPNEGFWNQLKVFQDQLEGGKEENRRLESLESLESGVDALVVTCSVNAMDGEWAKQSCMIYLACRDALPHEVLLKQCFGCVSLSRESLDPEAMEHVLFTCLDYIWGRGIIPAEVEWLSVLCGVLDSRTIRTIRTISDPMEMRNVSTEDAEDSEDAEDCVSKVSAGEMAIAMVLNPSRFTEQWEGEIYPEQIEVLTEALGK